MRKGAAEIRVGKTAECAPETAISGGRYSKEVRAVNRANTGGTGKKIPTGSGLGFHIMVEVGGIEPPSESTPSPALHAYPGR